MPATTCRLPLASAEAMAMCSVVLRLSTSGLVSTSKFRGRAAGSGVGGSVVDWVWVGGSFWLGARP